MTRGETYAAVALAIVALILYRNAMKAKAAAAAQAGRTTFTNNVFAIGATVLEAL